MNFRYLSDTDFEELSKDILEIYLDTKLETFAKGKDGGIDIKGFKNNSIIGQSKHYYLSSFSSLMTSLRGEYKNIIKLDPEYYFLFTSKDLTPDNMRKIRELFNRYMRDESNIFSLKRIESLLLEDEYKTVLLKHTKLWYFSYEILRQVIYTNKNFDVISLGINEIDYSKYFVRTNCFWKADKILKDNHVVIIKGDAGIGKTTTSRMLVNVYALKGYEPIIFSSSNIEKMKENIIQNCYNNKIILIDDFLGQRYSELLDTKISEFKSLIMFAIKSDKIKLILSSRITVINDALDRNNDFENFIDKNKYIYEINMNDISRVEKAKILISLLKQNNTSEDFIQEIKKTKSYFDIVNHKNYTPRVIEYIVNHYQKEDLIDVKKYIMNILDEAYYMWDNEFTHKLNSEDRLFLLVIYSLTNTYISYEIVLEVYNKLVSKLNLDYSFESCVKRLNGSFINILYFKNNRYFSVKNPSINDFLDKKLEREFSLIFKILNSSIYFEQVFHTFDSIKKVSEIYSLENINIFELKLASENKLWITNRLSRYHFIWKYNIRDKKYKENLTTAILEKLDNTDKEFMFLIYTTKEMIEFYEFNIYANFDAFINTFFDAEAYYFIKGILVYNQYFSLKNIHDATISKILSILEIKIKNYLTNNLEDWMDDALYKGAMSEYLENYDKYEYEFFDLLSKKEIVDDVRNAVKDLIEEMLSNDLELYKLSNLNDRISLYLNEIDFLNMTYVLEDERLYLFIKNYIEHKAKSEYNYEKYYYEYMEDKQVEVDENENIDNLFDKI